MKTFNQLTKSEKAWYRVATTTNQVDFYLTKALEYLIQVNLQTKAAGGTPSYSEDEAGLIEYLKQIQSSPDRLQPSVEAPWPIQYHRSSAASRHNAKVLQSVSDKPNPLTKPE